LHVASETAAVVFNKTNQALSGAGVCRCVFVLLLLALLLVLLPGVCWCVRPFRD